MKICLFGGIFDPPHIGHLMVAKRILKYYSFNRILFVPNQNPPHKNVKNITFIDHRLEMLRLLTKENSKFIISMEEINSRGKSFTINTIRLIKRKMGINSEDCFFAVGSDALRDFHNWKSAREILNEASVLVVVRPGFEKIIAKPWVLDGINVTPISSVEASSENIRRKIKTNQPIKNLLTEDVYDYIVKNRLYKQ